MNVSGEIEGVRRALAEVLDDIGDELADDLMLPSGNGIRRSWQDLTPAADAIIERLAEHGYMVLSDSSGEAS